MIVGSMTTENNSHKVTSVILFSNVKHLILLLRVNKNITYCKQIEPLKICKALTVN
jgi:hypothetical protein